MTPTRSIRLALAYLSIFSLQVGAWALFAPRSFYDGFPGFGRTWVAVDGPYNEHLVRDVGALNLALVVLFVSAAISLSRPLVIAAAGAALVWGVPHLLYHLVHTDGLGGLDLVASLGGLALFAAVPILLILTARKHLASAI